MKIAVLAVAAALLMAPQAALGQCRVAPLGLSEPEFLRRYVTRMTATGAGDLVRMSELGPDKRMYGHLPTHRTYSNVHTVAIEASDDMVRQVQFILDDNAPDTLAERIRIGAAFVLMQVPGTSEVDALAAIDRAIRKTRASRANATENVAEATVVTSRVDDATMISVGRLRC